MTLLALLPDRGVIAIAGTDRVSFLQGLVSNDVTQVGPDSAIWAAFLSPQGKWLADFFILTDRECLLLDCERDQAPDLARKLGRYRLRAQVTVTDVSADWHVHAAWDGSPPSAAIAARDPRLPEAGWRLLHPTALATTASAAEWNAHRLALGLPNGSQDLEQDKTVLLEAGFDELSGVSWTKGCYMGQELTARTKYRGLIKRRLLPVAVEGELPGIGTPIFHEGQDVGTMRSGQDGIGLATLRLDALGSMLDCGKSRLIPRLPDWFRLPAAQAKANASE